MESREERLRKIEMKMRHIKVVGSASTYVLRAGLVALAALSAGMLLLCFWVLRGERRQAQKPPAVIQIVGEEGKQDLREIVREEYAAYQTDMQNMLAIAGIVFTLFSIGIPIMQYVFIQKERVEELEKMMLLVEDEREKVDKAKKEIDGAKETVAHMHAEAEKKMETLLQQLVRQASDFINFKKDYLAIVDTFEQVSGDTGQYKGQIAQLTKKLSSMEQSKPQEAKGGSITGSGYMSAGNKAYGEGRYEDAVAAYSRARVYYEDESDGKNLAKANNNQGLAYNELGRFEEAIANYNKAIELAPDFAEAYHNRGYTCGELGIYKEAIADYSKVIELKPDYIKAYRNRAALYDETGNYDLAEKDRAEAKRLEEEQEKKEN